MYRHKCCASVLMVGCESAFVTGTVLEYSERCLEFKSSMKGESKTTPPKLGIISVFFLLRVAGPVAGIV